MKIQCWNLPLSKRLYFNRKRYFTEMSIRKATIPVRAPINPIKVQRTSGSCSDTDCCVQMKAESRVHIYGTLHTLTIAMSPVWQITGCMPPNTHLSVVGSHGYMYVHACRTCQWCMKFYPIFFWDLLALGSEPVWWVVTVFTHSLPVWTNHFLWWLCQPHWCLVPVYMLLLGCISWHSHMCRGSLFSHQVWCCGWNNWTCREGLTDTIISSASCAWPTNY